MGARANRPGLQGAPPGLDDAVCVALLLMVSLAEPPPLQIAAAGDEGGLDEEIGVAVEFEDEDEEEGEEELREIIVSGR